MIIFLTSDWNSIQEYFLILILFTKYLHKDFKSNKQIVAELNKKCWSKEKKL